MTKKEVEAFIISYNDDSIVRYFLSRVNLTTQEQELLKLRTKECLTQEKVAEVKQIAKNTVQRTEDSLYKKIIENWQGMDIIQTYINYKLKS